MVAVTSRQPSHWIMSRMPGIACVNASVMKCGSTCTERTELRVRACVRAFVRARACASVRVRACAHANANDHTRTSKRATRTRIHTSMHSRSSARIRHMDARTHAVTDLTVERTNARTSGNSSRHCGCKNMSPAVYGMIPCGWKPMMQPFPPPGAYLHSAARAVPRVSLPDHILLPWPVTVAL